MSPCLRLSAALESAETEKILSVVIKKPPENNPFRWSFREMVILLSQVDNVVTQQRKTRRETVDNFDNIIHDR